MRNFLILLVAFFGLLISGQAAYAQCPTQTDVNVKTSTNVTCFGANDGTITVDLADASVGPGAFNFDLYDLIGGAYVTLTVTETETPATRSVVYSNVPAGSYAVVFRKASCPTLTITQGVSGFDITEPPQLTVTNTIAPDCDATVGVGNGKIDLTITGGVAPYTTAWTGPTSVSANTVSTSATLDAGNYTINVRDANNCLVTLNLVVPVTTPANAGPPTGLACGTNNFALSGNAFAVGEIGTWTGPAGVTFSPNANTPNATANNLNVGANVLTWTITDAGFVCTGSSDNITVTFSNVDMTGSADVVLPCFGATTGSGTFSVAGGIAPFTYSIISNTSGATIVLPAPGPTTSVSFTNGGAGIVRLQVQDNSGCTDQVTITLTQPAAAVTASTTLTHVTCNGGNNGSILVTPTGGVAPYDFSINGGTTYTILAAANHTFTGLTAQLYNLRVRDANGCESVVLNRTITQPTAIVPNATPTAVLCFGDNTGSITVTPTGGVSPYDFSIDGGTTYSIIDGTTTTYSGLIANTYNIRVRDANNCETAVTPIAVNQPAAALGITTSPTDVACFGGNTGSILVTPSGGTAPYDFSSDGGATYPIADQMTAQTFTGLIAGNYNIQVRDANNCIISLPTTVNQPVALTAATTLTDVTCSGAATGSVLVTPAGGVAPYDFSIDNGVTYPVTDQPNNTFTGLAAGSYDIRVRDVNNCEFAVTVVITQPPSPVGATTTPTNATCFGGSDGSIFVTPSGGVSPYDFSSDGGVTYQITGTSGLFTGLSAGSYNIRVRDANGCETAMIVTAVGQATDITFTPGVVNASCFNGTDGSITVTPSGGTGPYDFSIDGGASYTVMDGTSNTFSNLAPQSYNLRVRDVNGCESSVIVQAVGASSPVMINGVNTTQASCSGINDGTIDINLVAGGVGPYQYSIDNGNTFQAASLFPGLAPGDYDAVVRDANNCASNPVTVSVGSGLIYDVTAMATDASCSAVSNGTVTVTGTTGGTAPFQYNIDGGAFQASTTFTGLGVGNHTVTAKDANGCNSNSFDITVGSNVVISSTNSPSPVTVCLGNDGSINVTGITGGTSPYDLSIDNGITFPVTDVTSNNFTNLTAGDYNIVIRDDLGCQSTAVLVTVAPPPGCVLNCFAFNVTVEPGTQRPTCGTGDDGVIVLTISGSSSGVYLVNLFNISVPTEVYPQQSGPSGKTYTFSGLIGGSYRYQIQDINGNICSTNFQWAPETDVQATATNFVDAPCFGVASGTALVDATGSSTGKYFYSVNGTDWTEFIPGSVINGLPANGTYNIEVGESIDDVCSALVSVTINNQATAALDTAYVSATNGFPAVSYPESPTATRVIGIEDNTLGPYEVRLELVDPYGVTPNPPFIIDWTPVDGTNPQSFIPQKQIDNLYAGEYVLSVRDALGCERDYAVFIQVDERIFIPNIFTPNKDEYNSTFFIRNLPEKGSKLSVTDRWGKEVYSSNDYNPTTLWDGGDTPDGVYFYRLQIKGGKAYTGWVEILRGSKP